MRKLASVEREKVRLSVTDSGGHGSPVLLLHGLAGASLELLPTGKILLRTHRVLLLDQRGHGRSTRRPADLSREAFVADVVDVLQEFCPGEKVTLIGQSMGAHAAFLVAHARPDLVNQLIMLEGHVAGGKEPEDSQAIGALLCS